MFLWVCRQALGLGKAGWDYRLACQLRLLRILLSLVATREKLNLDMGHETYRGANLAKAPRKGHDAWKEA